MNHPAELDPLPPHVHERRWMILAVLCLSLLIIVMDNTILNVAIPSLMTELGASNSQVQWIVDSYVLVFAGLLLTAGSLSDRFGRKGALQAGLLVYLAGSLVGAFAAGEDIHRSTAARIFGVEPREVTAEQRSRAKAINCGSSTR